MDIKDRVMGDQPNDFLHKIAGIIPGYKGYVDRERRRDADRLLRTELAHRYQAELTRLKRVQQDLLRTGDLNTIGELDGISGRLQRFIDRLQNATYGYTGLFDPIKVEAAELDQIYAFDMALTTGVDTLSGAIGALESGIDGDTNAKLRPAVDNLSTVVNDLNDRFDQRADLLTAGTTLPQNEYQAMVDGFQQPSQGGQAYPQQSQPETPSPYAQQGTNTSTTGTGSAGTYGNPGGGYGGGTPTASLGSSARVATTGQAGIAGSGASVDDAESPTTTGPIATAAVGQDHNMLPVDDPSIASGGTPTTRVSWGSSSTMQPDPAVDSMAQGNQGFGGTPTGTDQGGGAPMTLGGEAGSGIESASSPAVAPGAPGGDIVDSMDMANNLNALSDPGSVSSSDLSVDPGGPSSSLGGSTSDLNLNPGTTGGTGGSSSGG